MKEFFRFIVVCCTLFLNDPVVQSGECGVVTDKRVVTAHRYHGILLSYEDETGSYFMRDGQRCRLYSNAFKKRWKEKNEKP
jgi:hypothetical protein